MYVSMKNFVEIGHTIAEIQQFIHFVKMAAVRHCGFEGQISERPTTKIWWFLSLLVVLIIEKFKYFALCVWPKNAYSRPVLVVFGVKKVENGKFMHCYPSRNAITRN